MIGKTNIVTELYNRYCILSVIRYLVVNMVKLAGDSFQAFYSDVLHG